VADGLPAEEESSERLFHGGGCGLSFPGTTGFSTASLWRMRQLHEIDTAPDFLAQLVRETNPRARAVKAMSAAPTAKLSQAVREMVVAIPWGHHVNLLARWP
jgi:hypothetical protein